MSDSKRAGQGVSESGGHEAEEESTVLTVAPATHFDFLVFGSGLGSNFVDGAASHAGGLGMGREVPGRGGGMRPEKSAQGGEERGRRRKFKKTTKSL